MEERHELVGLLVAEAVAPPILHELELGVDPLADGLAVLFYPGAGWIMMPTVIPCLMTRIWLPRGETRRIIQAVLYGIIQ